MPKISRSNRWTNAAEAARDAIEGIKTAAAHLDMPDVRAAVSDLENALTDLRDVQDEYRDQYDNMSERSQEGDKGQLLETIGELEMPEDGLMDAIENAIIEAIETAIEEAEEVVDEAEGMELP